MLDDSPEGKDPTAREKWIVRGPGPQVGTILLRQKRGRWRTSRWGWTTPCKADEPYVLEDNIPGGWNYGSFCYSQAAVGDVHRGDYGVVRGRIGDRVAVYFRRLGGVRAMPTQMLSARFIPYCVSAG